MSLRGHTHAQIGIIWNLDAPHQDFVETFATVSLVGRRLTWPDELDMVATGLQSAHQLSQGHRHAIDFWRIRFCHHCEAQRLTVCTQIFNLDDGAGLGIHDSMLDSNQDNIVTTESRFRHTEVTELSCTVPIIGIEP